MNDSGVTHSPERKGWARCGRQISVWDLAHPTGFDIPGQSKHRTDVCVSLWARNFSLLVAARRGSARRGAERRDLVGGGFVRPRRGGRLAFLVTGFSHVISQRFHQPPLFTNSIQFDVEPICYPFFSSFLKSYEWSGKGGSGGDAVPTPFPVSHHPHMGRGIEHKPENVGSRSGNGTETG
jgi:hypothetical protein